MLNYLNDHLLHCIPLSIALRASQFFSQFVIFAFTICREKLGITTCGFLHHHGSLNRDETSEEEEMVKVILRGCHLKYIRHEESYLIFSAAAERTRRIVSIISALMPSIRLIYCLYFPKRGFIVY